MKKINTGLIISIFIIIWIDYIPFKLPSFVEYPEKFEYVIYNLSLAYMASYIFYYINNYLPEKKNSKIIKKVIHNNIIDIITYRKILLNIKNTDFDENPEIVINRKKVHIEEYLQKFQKKLHKDLDSILTIKERLPTELLNYSLLLKRHPYFITDLKDFKNFNKYVDSYDLLSNKLYLEYKKTIKKQWLTTYIIYC
ncbi:hypothetical protein [Formosa algae]|uniref:hypothetical protein n=1 Tax=Formosa algae TaxID=225843 RepID=UPI000CCF41B8|nr:hypothetical protein [Formosa algae]PNW26437.1 hypothetical protein BKP44_17065 [Formosa algae]